MHTRHITVIIAVSAVLLFVGVIVVVVLILAPKKEEPSANRTNAAANASVQNTNTPGEAGSGSAGNTNAQVEVTYTGKVFLKGYGTRSESFGIATGEGYEIGLGSYDAKKEEFRPYIGDVVTVTFSSTCRSNTTDCCRSLFDTCGMVKSWQPVKK